MVARRKVISISLPKSILDIINREIEKGRFASKSEFFRQVIRYWYKAQETKRHENKKELIQMMQNIIEKEPYSE